MQAEERLQPVGVFVSYSHVDRELRDRLRQHLTLLTAIEPNWDGTIDQIGKVVTLLKSRDYADKPFQLEVDKAIDNFDRKRIVDCDCAHVQFGLLTNQYQTQCAIREDQLWQEIKETGTL